MGIGSQYLPLHDDGSSNSGISSAGTSRSSTPSSFIYGSPRRHYYFRVARIKWIVYWSICGILLFLMVSLFIWPQQWKVFWGNRASSSSIPYDNIDVGMSSGQEDEEEQQELPIEINNSTQQVPDFSIYDSWKPVSITNASFHSQYERYLQCPYLDGQDTCALTKRISINGYEWQGQGELSTIRQQNLLETARKCLKGVRVGFSGDSLTRQQYHSWACMLYNTGVEIVKEKENDVLTAHKVNELEHAFYWTGNQLNPYFVKSNRARGEKAKFYFEELDPDMVTLMDANPDYLVLNTGHWCDSSSYGANWLDAYTKIISSSLSNLQAYFSNRTATQKPHLIFVTNSLRHFENGDFNNGGSCTRTSPTSPTIDLETFAGGKDHALQNEILESQLKKLNSSLFAWSIVRGDVVSRIRADAHHTEKDCSHFCLPGVPDVWNGMVLKRICELEGVGF